MSSKAASPDAVALLESALEALPCEKKTMFGCPVYLANGSLFAGVRQTAIFVRLSAADRDAFLEEHKEALPFEPLPGRRMREYLVIPAAVAEDTVLMKRWLRRAHDYAAALPPKVRRRRS